jgi:hypothetical protein
VFLPKKERLIALFVIFLHQNYENNALHLFEKKMSLILT